MRNLTQHIVSLAVQPHLQGREIDSNVSSCGGERKKGQEGVKQRFIRHSQGLICFFPIKPDLGQRYICQIEPSFWKEIAENTLASWLKERRGERPKKERTFTIRKFLNQKEANKREEMKWKARFRVRAEGRAKQSSNEKWKYLHGLENVGDYRFARIRIEIK